MRYISAVLYTALALGANAAHADVSSAEAAREGTMKKLIFSEATSVSGETFTDPSGATYTLDDFRDTAQAIFDGRLGALDWVETRPLSDGQAAFEDILAGQAAAPKIILKPEA